MIIAKTKVLCGLIVPGLPSKEDYIEGFSKVQKTGSPEGEPGGRGHVREVTPADEERLTKENIEKLGN